MGSATPMLQREQIANALEAVRSLDGDHAHTIAQLHAKLDLLPSMAQSDALPSTESRVFRFMDLPPELRDMIYDLCLVKGKVFLRPRSKQDERYEGYRDFERPELQLLAVARQIRAEVAVILIRHNHFIISSEYDEWRTLLGPLWSGTPDEGRHIALAAHGQKHLTSISITFDIRNMFTDALEMAQVSRDEEQLTGSAEAVALRAHGHIDQYYGQWECLCEEAAISPQLRFFQINLANCLCPIGCHRLVSQAASAVKGARFGRRLQVIEVLGTISGAERKSFLQRLFDDEVESDDEGDMATFAECRPVVRFRKAPLKAPNPNSLYTTSEKTEEGLDDEDVDLGPLIDAYKRKHGTGRDSHGTLAGFIL
ncbi:hypothetical protein LTR85_005450 [Meristemomyces frigidus]|nr:hypothetical protein LTR85_005450 [Meristemomyces frigidus]